MSTTGPEIGLMIVLDRAHDPGDPNRPCWDGDPDEPIWALYTSAEDDSGEWNVTLHGEGMTKDQAFELSVHLGLDAHWIIGDFDG